MKYLVAIWAGWLFVVALFASMMWVVSEIMRWVMA